LRRGLIEVDPLPGGQRAAEAGRFGAVTGQRVGGGPGHQSDGAGWLFGPVPEVPDAVAQRRDAEKQEEGMTFSTLHAPR
jgi:hypothetical protein